MEGESNQRQHSERMSSLFNENNQCPHYLFKVMHLLGNVILFLCLKNTDVLPLLVFSSVFMTERVFGLHLPKKKMLSYLSMEIAMEP